MRNAPLRNPAVAAAALTLVGYVAIARGVNNLYPFSAYPMYTGGHATSGSRLGARDASGAVRELTEYEAWACDGPVDLAPRCEGPESVGYIPYLERAASEYFASHRAAAPAAGAGRVDVVRRVWTFPARGAARVRDCLVQRCRAVRRAGAR